MANGNSYELNLSSDAFNAFKSDFNNMLRQILFAMENKEAEDGTMNIKFSITLKKEDVPDPTASHPDALRAIIKPAFEHKISSQITLKTSTSGILRGEFELVWDKESQSYVIRPIDNGQMTMDDIVYQNSDPDSAADLDSEGLPLQPPRVAELPPATPDDEGSSYEPPLSPA